MINTYPFDTEFAPLAPLFKRNLTGPIASMEMPKKNGEELSRSDKNLGLPIGGWKVCIVLAFLIHLTQLFRSRTLQCD